MLLDTLWSGNIEGMVNFEGLVLLGPLDAEVLVINFYCRLYHANCIADSSTLMLRGLLTLELGLQLNWHREWILKWGMLALDKLGLTKKLRWCPYQSWLQAQCFLLSLKLGLINYKFLLIYCHSLPPFASSYACFCFSRASILIWRIRKRQWVCWLFFIVALSTLLLILIIFILFVIFFHSFSCTLPAYLCLLSGLYRGLPLKTTARLHSISLLFDRVLNPISLLLSLHLSLPNLLIDSNPTTIRLVPSFLPTGSAPSIYSNNNLSSFLYFFGVIIVPFIPGLSLFIRVSIIFRVLVCLIHSIFGVFLKLFNESVTNLVKFIQVGVL